MEARDSSSSPSCTVTQRAVLGKTVLSVDLGFLIYKMTGQVRRVSKILTAKGTLRWKCVPTVTAEEF